MRIIGKKERPLGVTPAIGLINPKYPRNVGQAMRAASCFGVDQVWYTGNRVSMEPEKGKRLPREERMKGYSKVELIQFDYFLDQFPEKITPVAIELTPNSEIMTTFEHPENPLYIFGPEDGSVPQVIKQHCHRFVAIPTQHCTNLAAAIYLTLYDRSIKRQLTGLDPIPTLQDILDEPRGWANFEDITGGENSPKSERLCDILDF